MTGRKETIAVRSIAASPPSVLMRIPFYLACPIAAGLRPAWAHMSQTRHATAGGDLGGRAELSIAAIEPSTGGCVNVGLPPGAPPVFGTGACRVMAINMCYFRHFDR